MLACVIVCAQDALSAEVRQIFRPERFQRGDTNVSRLQEIDDASLDGVQKVCVRGMQMDAHEIMCDGPHCEQQMYTGDALVQCDVMAAMYADDRLACRRYAQARVSRRNYFADTGRSPLSAALGACQPTLFPDWEREKGNEAGEYFQRNLCDIVFQHRATQRVLHWLLDGRTRKERENL